MAGLRDLFGWSIKRKEPTDKERLAITSPVPPTNDDGAYTIDSTQFGFVQHLIDVDGTFREEADLIRNYRDIATHPEADRAIEDIVNEAIVSQENAAPVKINLDNLAFSDDLKTKISNEFDRILTLLKFSLEGHEIFRSWYIDGRLYYHVLIDKTDTRAGIQELRRIDPCDIKKIREERKEKTGSGIEIVTAGEEYYAYTQRISIFGGMRNTTNSNMNVQILKLTNDSVVYVNSGIQDYNKGIIISYLHKAIKPINQLRMLEDAVVIYRLARAAARRVFYIDVGNLPKQKAEQYLKSIMLKYKNKMVYDVISGAVRDNVNQLSMMEDFWLPRREGGRSTEITSLEEGQNLSNIEDVVYFQKKMYKALNVPPSRMESEAAFNIGRPSEISRDELNFAKFVFRLRKRFSDLFYELLKTQLILKNVISEEDWNSMKEVIGFDFLKDSFFSELKDAEILRERLNTMTLATPLIGTFLSVEWCKKNIMMQSDDEIEEIKKQNEKEKGAGEQSTDVMPFNPEIVGLGMQQDQMDMAADTQETQLAGMEQEQELAVDRHEHEKQLDKEESKGNMDIKKTVALHRVKQAANGNGNKKKPPSDK